MNKMRDLLRRLVSIPFLVVGAALAFFSLGAINYIVNNFWPIKAQQRLDLVREAANDTASAARLLDAAQIDILFVFYVLVILTIAGIFLPLVFYLNKRFHHGTLQPTLVILRQAGWVGIWVAFCLWMQMNRTFGVAVAVLVLGVLVMFEVLLQVRHRASAHGEFFQGSDAG